MVKKTNQRKVKKKKFRKVVKYKKEVLFHGQMLASILLFTFPAAFTFLIKYENLPLYLLFTVLPMLCWGCYGFILPLFSREVYWEEI